jgi:hypothetical protein
MTVTVYDEQYQCNTAVKGESYVRLYDDNGICFISFNGISNFTGYEINGGEWTSPEAIT